MAKSSHGELITSAPEMGDPDATTYTTGDGVVHQFAPPREAPPAGTLVESESVVARKQREASLELARQTLNAVASSPYVSTGTPLAAEDRSAFIDDALADVKDAPAKVKAAYRSTVENIVRAIESGDRLAAEQLAREGALSVADASKTWDASSVAQPDPRALAEAIHAAQYGGTS